MCFNELDDFSLRKLCFLLFCPKDDACGPDGEKSAVGDDATLAVTENLVVDKRACIAGSVAKYIFQLPVFVATNVDDAMCDVDAGVDGLDGAVDAAVLLVAADDVIAHREGNDLLEVEHVLDDDNRAAAAGVSLFVGIHVVALGVAKL